MTDNEIIKALEEHIERTKNIKYGKRKMATVDVELLKDALDLINRSKAEVGRYKQTVGELAVRDGKVVSLLNGKETEYIQKGVADTLKRMAVKSAKAETVKEIIERLESEITISDKYVRKYNDSKDRTYNNSLREVLKIVKEMVGEN